MILDEVEKERDHQREKWGSWADDNTNAPMDFVGYIAHHSTRWFDGGFRPYSRNTMLEYRRQMVKVAALAVAAIEATDKLLDGKNKRPDIMED